jgi:hypothetical protein
LWEDILMSDYLFKWKIGDIVKITSGSIIYYIIYGMSEYDENRHRYPSYLAKKFAYKKRMEILLVTILKHLNDLGMMQNGLREWNICGIQ